MLNETLPLVNADELYPVVGIPAKAKEVRQQALNDLETFIRLIVPSQVMGHCHQDLCKWITTHYGENKLILWPRDHGKSRYAAFYTAWRIVRNPAITVIYASNTSAKAVEMLTFVKDILTSEQSQRYFPGLVSPEPNKRKKWNSTEIVVDHPSRAQMGVVDSTVLTAGIGTSLTGRHCGLLVLDDIVVMENAMEESGRRNVATWMSQASAVCSADSEQFVVGTRYHPKDEYGTMINMDYTLHGEQGQIIETAPVYQVNEQNVETDGVYLWPRSQAKNGQWYGFNAQILAKKKANFEQRGEITQFFAQYYNDPNDRTSAPISRDLFRYYNKDLLQSRNGVWYFQDKVLRTYIAADLAASTGTKSDYTALVAGGIADDGSRFLLHLDRYRSDRTTDTIDRLGILIDTYSPVEVAIEAVSGFGLVAQSIIDELENRGYRAPFELVNNLNGQSKMARINGQLEPHYRSKAVWHFRGGLAETLEDELVNMHPAHDDLKDAWGLCNSRMKKPVKQVTYTRRNINNKKSDPRFGGFGYRRR